MRARMLVALVVAVLIAGAFGVSSLTAAPPAMTPLEVHVANVPGDPVPVSLGAPVEVNIAPGTILNVDPGEIKIDPAQNTVSVANSASDPLYVVEVPPAKEQIHLGVTDSVSGTNHASGFFYHSMSGGDFVVPEGKQFIVTDISVGLWNETPRFQDFMIQALDEDYQPNAQVRFNWGTSGTQTVHWVLPAGTVILYSCRLEGGGSSSQSVIADINGYLEDVQ